MNKKLVWEDRFNIGVEIIDKEHKNLFKIINKLFEFQDDSEKASWACLEGIKFFKTHVVKHFADEEAYMQSIGYEGLEMHRRMHADFRDKTLPSLIRELEETEYSQDAMEHFLGVCTGWLVSHTLLEDRAIVGKGKSRWTGIQSKEASDRMEEVVCKELYEVFKLEARLFSESYGGEKFGKGLYYRLIYGNPEGHKWEACLAFEENLLLNTVGKMLDVKTKRVDALIVNAVRFMARKFEECIIDRFYPEDNYTLISENLLTYEQFKNVYERKNPQFSQLYDTGVGYFAQCLILSDDKVPDVGTSIEAANAIKQISNFLKQNEEESQTTRKKVLVVDDSSVMREFLKELLEDTYEVSSAASGILAIRSMTLNCPDLVLLDYEMPSCDGRQLLEMMRNDEVLKHTAVIFLTNRGDRQSIEKIMKLKPSGYLLKSLKPEEIKDNINQYFQKIS